jgi:hypothetical protein
LLVIKGYPIFRGVLLPGAPDRASIIFIFVRILPQLNLETIRSLSGIVNCVQTDFVLGYWLMKKILGTIALGLLLSGNVYAASFSIGKKITNNFIYDKKIKISLKGDNWEVIRKNFSLDYGIKQQIVGIGRIENNEIMEIIEVYEGDLAGRWISDVDPIIIEMVFHDQHDGCYERPEYYLLELYRKGSTYNCMVVSHMDVTKELNYPDSPHGKAAASAYNFWIKQKSLSYPKIMFSTYHGYFSRLAGGTWYEIRHHMNPKILDAPKAKFFSEETSEYHKINISQYPKHKVTMNKWIAVSSEFHKNFEDMVKARSNHKLNLDQYYMEIKRSENIQNELTDQLQKLNELYKAGVLTKEEFTKAKKKILN